MATAGGRGTWQPAGSSLSSAWSATVASVPRHGPHPASGGWGERACVRPDGKECWGSGEQPEYLLQNPKARAFHARAPERAEDREEWHRDAAPPRGHTSDPRGCTKATREPPRVPAWGAQDTQRVGTSVLVPLSAAMRGLWHAMMWSGGSATAAETPALLRGRSRQPLLCVRESSGRWAWPCEAGCGMLWKVWPDETRSRISRERPASLW